MRTGPFFKSVVFAQESFDVCRRANLTEPLTHFSWTVEAIDYFTLM